MKYPIKRDRLKYPLHGWLLTSRDLAGFSGQIHTADSFGGAIYEAELRAFSTAIALYIEQHIPIPLPSALEEGEDEFAVPLLLSVKIALYNEMLRQGKTFADLSLNCGFQPWKMKQIFLERERDVSLDFVSTIALHLNVELKLDFKKIEQPES